MQYHKSAERMDVAVGEWHPIADMHVPRTGLAVCAGPDSCVYAVGGSPNGAKAHMTAERWVG